jgi:hypothetical protein
MAFSDDLVELALGVTDPKTVLWVDVVLLLIAFGLTLIGQVATGRISAGAACISYAIGAALTLGVDARLAYTNPDPPYPIWTAIFYYIGFLFLASASMAVNPLHLRGENSSETQARFVLGVPLLVGTLGAYAVSYSWQWTGAVSREYFAQISQVIPLLFVAVGFEGGYFRRRHAETSEPNKLSERGLRLEDGQHVGATLTGQTTPRAASESTERKSRLIVVGLAIGAIGFVAGTLRAVRN